MSHKRSSSARSGKIRVRPEARKEPDLRRLGQAVIAFAMRSDETVSPPAAPLPPAQERRPA